MTLRSRLFPSGNGGARRKVERLKELATRRGTFCPRSDETHGRTVSCTTWGVALTPKAMGAIRSRCDLILPGTGLPCACAGLPKLADRRIVVLDGFAVHIEDH